MSIPLGSEAALALASGPVPDGLVVALGDAVAAATAPVVRFGGSRQGPHELLIATHGDGLWRRGPWPAADVLFESAEPGPGAGALVVGPRAGEVADRLAARDVPAVERPALGRYDLARAAVVVFTGAAFPEHAFAVAAAARVLVLPSPEPLFGLQDAIDCFCFEHADQAATIAEAAFRAPEAFAAVGHLARLSAEPHRASRVYARLAVDLEAGLGRVGDARNDRSASST